MRVTLAYPIADLGQPDDTVEVPNARGRQLLRDGYARSADDKADKPTRAHKPTTKEVPADGR